MWNPFERKPTESNIVSDVYIPSLGGLESGILTLTEQFKGEVENNTIKTPSELGEEHPFNFKTLEKLYEKFGFFTAVVDKYIDFIIGPGFFVKSDEPRAQEIIEQFMQDVNFDSLLRQWTKEALIKGNGFLELGGTKKESVNGLKILNANYMYIKRDKYGIVEEYNQYKGAFDKFAKDKVIPFKPFQIAHVPFNLVGDNAYGLGLGYPAMQLMDNLLSQSSDMHKIMKRKANSPLHAKLGKMDGTTKIIPKKDDVEAFRKQMEIMGNKTDWATDPLVELSVVDFGNIGDKFLAVLEYDIQMLFYAFQIPAVIMGMAKVNEGLAKVQMEAFQRRVQSIQVALEKVIETKIFKRVLESNGFSDEHVELEWGTPSVLEVEGRMQTLKDLISAPMTSPAMRLMAEDEIVLLLKLDKNEWEQLKLKQAAAEEEERKRLEAEAVPIVPGQNKNFPKATPARPQPVPVPKVSQQSADIKKGLEEINKKISKLKVAKKTHTPVVPLMEEKVKKKITEEHKHDEYKDSCPHCKESFDSITDIEEWLGFNYKTYVKDIKEAVKNSDFKFIKGVTEAQLTAGLFTEAQVNELRKILDKGFTNGESMTTMAKAVDKKVKPKDLYRMEDGAIKKGASGLPILSRSAEKRSIGIVRTEVTRLANEGAIKSYKRGGIEKVTWIASFGDRTCPECEGYDGKIYEINSTPAMPAHPLCRCTFGPVTELV